MPRKKQNAGNPPEPADENDRKLLADVEQHVMLIDVSHVVEDGMITYKGLPAPLICDFLSREQSRALYAPGTEFQIGKIEMVANTGTYLDSPFHRYADGKDLSELPLERVANLDAILISADPHGRGIGRSHLSATIFAARPSWSVRDGTDTGEQTGILKAIPS